MMICTPCGEVIDDGDSVIFGVTIDGVLRFAWACVHNPVGDAEVVLGSECCALTWLEKNPQYKGILLPMIDSAKVVGPQCEHEHREM